MIFDVAIIGCGVVGASAAYALARYRVRTVILERDNDVSGATSKANSAILHAGYDPHPGTLMARLNLRGAALAMEICAKLDVPYRRCGSLVVAFSDEELPQVRALYERGIQNGVPDLKIVDQSELRAMEPNISEAAVGALYAPTAAVVSPWELTLALAETAVRNGAELRLDTAALSITRAEHGYRIHTNNGDVDCRYILNAAGLHADEIHNMISAPKFTIKPDRGEYFLLDKSEGTRARYITFQCPTKLGKGTLVSPTVHGNLIVGPNNEPPASRGDVATSLAGLNYVRAAAQKSIPSISFRDNIRNFSGIRAATEIDDFIIEEAADAPGFVDLAGIKSPGLTAAPAIGEMAVEILEKCGLELTENPDFVDRRHRLRFAELSPAERAEIVKKNPAYGHVICRCETVTEGEILDALHTPISPRSVDAVKRRCSPGMGRCQGGFCGPRVVEILSRELGLDPTEILNDKAGSQILVGETKGGRRHV